MTKKILCILRSALNKFKTLIIELIAEEIIKISTTKGIVAFRIDFKQLKMYLKHNTVNYAVSN